MRGLEQESADGSASTEPNEIPFVALDGLLDVCLAIFSYMRTVIDEVSHQTAETLAKSLMASLNEQLQDPKTSLNGVRLGAYP